MGLPLSDCSPVGVGRMLGVVVVRVVVVRRDVVRVVDPVVGVAFVVAAVVPPPGNVGTVFGANAERTDSGDAIATPMTPSATTSTTAIATLASRVRPPVWGCCCTAYGYGCHAAAPMYGGAGCWDGQPTCAGAPGGSGCRCGGGPGCSGWPSRDTGGR